MGFGQSTDRGSHQGATTKGTSSAAATNQRPLSTLTSAEALAITPAACRMGTPITGRVPATGFWLPAPRDTTSYPSPRSRLTSSAHFQFSHPLIPRHRWPNAGILYDPMLGARTT